MQTLLRQFCRILCPILCAACAALAFLPGSDPVASPGERLVFAAGSANEPSVTALLDAGVDINISVPIYGSPLNRAVIGGCTGTIRLLIQRGAEVDHPNVFNNTPLWFASGVGNAEIVTMLINAGANVNHRGNAGVTPLMVAICSGDTECVRVLLAAGADPAATDDAGHSAWDEARADDNQAALELLSKMERRCLAADMDTAPGSR
jgi:ankyrin repeat protein